MVTKLKFKNYITSCSKNLRNQRTLRCKKNSLQVSYNSAKLVDDDFKTRRKTINAEFIQTRALSQLSFVPFRPYTTSFLELVLSLTPVSKSKRTPETSLDLTSSFKASVDASVEGLVLHRDHWRCSFVQKKKVRKRYLPRTHVSFSGL